MLRNLLIFALLMELSGFCAEPTGFSDIPFGRSKQRVVEDVLTLGYNPMGQGSSDRVVIPVYKMGDLPVEVTFFFNSNNKFFSFELRTGRLPKEKYPKVIEAAKYMSKAFERKYGKASKKHYPRQEEVKHGFRTFYWNWALSRSEIYTSLCAMDGRYFVIGSVTNKSLAQEKASSKGSGEASIDRAANSF
jgi:hypothetical protein